MTGLIDVEGICTDVLVKEIAQKNKVNDDDEETSLPQLYIKDNGSPDDWLLDFNYPILACVDKNRSGELIIAQMASGTNEQLLLKLNFGKFICFVKGPLNTGPGRDIYFIAYDSKVSKLFLYKLSAEKELFHKGGLLKAKNWQKIHYQELKGKEFKRLLQIKDTIKSVQYFNTGGHKRVDQKSVDDKVTDL